jgi:hypothetical protein
MTTTESFESIIREISLSSDQQTDPRGSRRDVGRPVPAWVRLLSRIRATSLDRRLASGQAPETDRVLAARARALLAPQSRRQLAADWGNLLDRASKAPAGRGTRAPLCRDRILGAEQDVRELITVLTAPSEPAVRGVATANLLLSDGAGPLYNPRARVGLRAALSVVTDATPTAG